MLRDHVDCRAIGASLLLAFAGCEKGASPPPAPPSTTGSGADAQVTTPSPSSPVTADRIFFILDHGRVLRYDAGRFVVVWEDGPSPARDLATRREGGIYLLSKGVHIIDDRGVRDLPSPPTEEIVAIDAASDGSLIALTSAGLARYDGSKWKETPRHQIIDPLLTDPKNEWVQFVGLATDTNNQTYLLDSQRVFVEHQGTGRSFIRPSNDLLLEAIATGGDGSFALLQSHQIQRLGPDGIWTTFENPLDEAMRTLHVAFDGTITAGAFESLVIVRWAAPVRVDLATLGVKAAVIHAVARDREGHTWIATEYAVIVLSPSNELVARWDVATTPNLREKVAQIHVLR